MANLSRYLQKIFGSAASAGRMSEFGSLQTGSPATYSGATITPDIVQTLSNYSAGMDGAVILNASPALQDHNSLFYLFSYQLAYLTQKGIPEYLATQTYYLNDLCQSGGVVYQSLINTNLGNAPESTVGTDWTPVALGNAKNWLINSNFDFWQRATTASVSGSAQTYVADRWYINSSHFTSTVSGTRASGGATAASKYSFTLANAGGGASGSCEMYQMLENADSVQFTNQVASLSAQIQANNNVTQVGITFVYETTETRSTGANLIGSEHLFTINSSGYTLCNIFNQAMGSSFGANGVIGIRIRPTAVSSGNLWSINNGVIVSQVQLNLGAAPSSYRRAGQNLGDELKLCQRYFEKSYNIADSIAAVTTANCIEYYPPTAVGQFSIRFNTTKRVSNGTNNVLSTQTGTGGKAYDVVAAGDVSMTIEIAGDGGFGVFGSGLTTTHLLRFHWEADAEI